MMKYKGELALLFVALIWGTGYVMTSVTLEQFGIFQILAARFLLSTIILSAVFYKKILTLNKTDIKHGIILGVLLITAYAFQTIGLLHTTPAKNAFITASCVVIVPFISTIIYRHKIDIYNISGGFTALSGIALMSTFDSHISIGDILTFAGTILFAFHLFYTSEIMSHDADVPKVVTVQMGTCAVVSLIATLITGHTGFSHAQTNGIVILFSMAIFTTSLCYFAQSWAQKFINETKASIILSTECIFGAMFSVVLGFENLTSNMFFGAILILSGVLITEVRPIKIHKWFKTIIIPKKEYLVIITVLSIFFIILESRFPYFFLHDDNRSQFLPFYVSNYNSILKGEIPFFSFNQFAGIPYMSNGQSGVFFIPAYICVFLSKFIFGHVYFAIDILSYFLIIIASLGMFFFLREIRINKLGTLIGALFYPLNSFVIHIGNSWIVVIGAAAFFPLMMFYALKLFHNPTLKNCMKLVICRVLLFTMGHMQYFSYALILEIAFYLTLYSIEIFFDRSLNKQRKQFSLQYKKIIIYMFSGIALFFATLPILLPCIERMENSLGRSSAMPYEAFIMSGTNIMEFLIGLLNPYNFNGLFQFSSFCGHITLALCAICVVTTILLATLKKRNFYSKFMFALFLVALFCFLWQTNIIAPLIYKIPIINRFRWHYKLQALFFFFPPVFAAIGFSLLSNIINVTRKNNTNYVIIFSTWLLIALQIIEFVHIYAFTYDKPLSLRTWGDTPPYEEPLTDILTDGRYIPVGFEYTNSVSFHTTGYAFPQMFGLYSITGYDNILPIDNLKPSLGLNFPGFYNDLINEKYEISDLEHFRNWGVSYYVVNNKYLERNNNFPIGTLIYKDENRTVFHDDDALPLVFKGDELYTRLDFTIGVNKICLNIPPLDRDTHFYFNIVNNSKFICVANNNNIKIVPTEDNKMSVLVPAETSLIVLKYVESSFWLGLVIAIAFFTLYIFLYAFFKFFSRFNLSKTPIKIHFPLCYVLLIYKNDDNE